MYRAAYIGADISLSGITALYVYVNDKALDKTKWIERIDTAYEHKTNLETIQVPFKQIIKLLHVKQMHLCPTVIETYVEVLILALLWLASNKTG